MLIIFGAKINQFNQLIKKKLIIFKDKNTYLLAKQIHYANNYTSANNYLLYPIYIIDINIIYISGSRI